MRIDILPQSTRNKTSLKPGNGIDARKDSAEDSFRRVIEKLKDLQQSSPSAKEIEVKGRMTGRTQNFTGAAAKPSLRAAAKNSATQARLGPVRNKVSVSSKSSLEDSEGARRVDNEEKHLTDAKASMPSQAESEATTAAGGELRFAPGTGAGAKSAVVSSESCGDGDQALDDSTPGAEIETQVLRVSVNPDATGRNAPAEFDPSAAAYDEIRSIAVQEETAPSEVHNSERHTPDLVPDFGANRTGSGLAAASGSLEDPVALRIAEMLDAAIAKENPEPSIRNTKRTASDPANATIPRGALQTFSTSHPDLGVESLPAEMTNDPTSLPEKAPSGFRADEKRPVLEMDSNPSRMSNDHRESGAITHRPTLLTGAGADGADGINLPAEQTVQAVADYARLGFTYRGRNIDGVSAGNAQLDADRTLAGAERSFTGLMVSDQRPGDIPATPTRPTQTIFGDQDFLFQLADKMRIQVQSGGGEIRIQLKPEFLGRLEIRAETLAGSVVARIAAESNGVKQYLENNLHVLRQSFEDQGLKVDRIDVVLQDTLNSRQSYAQQHQAGGSDPDPRESGSRGHILSSDQERNAPREDVLDLSTVRFLRPDSTFYTVA